VQIIIWCVPPRGSSLLPFDGTFLPFDGAHFCHSMVHIPSVGWCTLLLLWLSKLPQPYPSSTLLLSLSLPCTHQPDDNVHVGAATYENISAISNATSSTLDEKEKCWSPTHYSVPYEKIPTPLLDGSKVPVHNPNSSNCTRCNYFFGWFLANL
jgi:hypothetical protein